jgi:hypothetical protein
MTLQSDCSVGLKIESTYGTGVTVDRWHEFVSEEITQDNEYIDSEGLRVGGVGVDLGRRTLGKVVAGGSYELEWVTRGLGTLLQAMLGSNTSTLRSGSIYQQVAVPATTDPMPAYTVQKGVPPIGGGTTLAHTFLGAVVNEWKLSCKSGEALMAEVDWVAKEMVTATAYAAPSYVASPKTLAYPHLALSIGVNGTHTLTVPTATAVGLTTATALTNVIALEVTGKNNVDDGGYASGGAGKRSRRPVYGLREFAGSMTAEFDAVTLRDYYLAQNDLHMVATFTSDADTGFGASAALQIVIPSLRLEGKVPSSNAGDVIEQEIDFTIGRTSSQSTIYVVAVTADTAL